MGSHSHRATRRRWWMPPGQAVWVVCGCWSMLVPTRMPGTMCVPVAVRCFVSRQLVHFILLVFNLTFVSLCLALSSRSTSSFWSSRFPYYFNISCEIFCSQSHSFSSIFIFMNQFVPHVLNRWWCVVAHVVGAGVMSAVCCQTQDGSTALMFAAMKGRTNCARLFVKHGADKDAKDNVRALHLIWFSCVLYLSVLV